MLDCVCVMMYALKPRVCLTVFQFAGQKKSSKVMFRVGSARGLYCVCVMTYALTYTMQRERVRGAVCVHVLGYVVCAYAVHFGSVTRKRRAEAIPNPGKPERDAA